MGDSTRSSLRTYLLYLLSVVAAITFSGAWAFDHFERGANEKVRSFWDSLWWAVVTMTTIGYGDIYPETAGGRLSAVYLMFAGIGVLGVSTAAIAAYFVKTDPFLSMRLRRLRNHVVICGLGDTGLLLAKAFRERGDAVLVIEREETNGLIEPCREQGSIVLIGNATEREILSQARVPEARYLIAVCGDDGANAEVAAHARDMVGRRAGGVLTCATNIVDPELWYLLRKWEIATVGSFRLQFFNVFDLGARALLNEHPPFPDGAPEPPHLLVVGATRLAQNLVVHAARLWQDRHQAPEERLHVTIVDHGTERLKESLYLRHPGLERTCVIDTYPIELKSPEFHQAAFLYDAQKRFSVTAVYVCLDDDAQGLSAALALFHRVRRHHVPVVVRMTQDAGLATLLHAARDSSRGFDNLHAVALLERICHPDLVLGGTNEVLARAIHSKYLQDQLNLGHDQQSNPALVPWDKLPEQFKESNRSQADHIGLKLQAIGCDLAPLTEWDAHAFAFTPEEVERMAEMEHVRWVEERKAQGWTYGPRDNAKKTNPNMVDWSKLPEDSKTFNRDVILGLPLSLARAGFQIYRLQSSEVRVA